MLANDTFHIGVLPGDGIGPEVMAPALEVLRKVEATTPGLKFKFTEAAAGAGHYRDTGKSMPDSTIKLCRDADAILLGSAGRSRGGLGRGSVDDAGELGADRVHVLAHGPAVDDRAEDLNGGASPTAQGDEEIGAGGHFLGTDQADAAG